MNWSGRGQHAEFGASEAADLENILQVHCILGHSATAIVEKVQCKRILLARKRVRCNWQTKREDAIKEVAHLQRLRHSHIVRGVGTYLFGNELSILLYPAADYNLESFLDLCFETGSSSSPSAEQLTTLNAMLHDLRRFFECLTNTIHFIHDQLVKHMDIKPSNILVKKRQGRFLSYKAYVADFGISRSYGNAKDVETQSHTPFTKTYAAPEVVRQDRRGFGAGIFRTST